MGSYSGRHDYSMMDAVGYDRQVGSFAHWVYSSDLSAPRKCALAKSSIVACRRQRSLVLLRLPLLALLAAERGLRVDDLLFVCVVMFITVSVVFPVTGSRRIKMLHAASEVLLEEVGSIFMRPQKVMLGRRTFQAQLHPWRRVGALDVSN
uniref:Uncharacterized protein n=1 Tax=Strombidium inclinatum TaxID=197538 RepID=A0A7S3N0C5_9SPIT